VSPRTHLGPDPFTKLSGFSSSLCCTTGTGQICAWTHDQTCRETRSAVWKFGTNKHIGTDFARSFQGKTTLMPMIHRKMAVGVRTKNGLSMLLYATMTLRTATQIPVTVQLLGLHWIKNKAHLLACILSSAGLTPLAVPVLEERGAQGSRARCSRLKLWKSAVLKAQALRPALFAFASCCLLASLSEVSSSSFLFFRSAFLTCLSPARV
jgi:hypothetical protein